MLQCNVHMIENNIFYAIGFQALVFCEKASNLRVADDTFTMTHRVAADELSALDVQGGVGKVAAGLRRGSGQDAALGHNQEQDGESKSGGLS